jgi:hypothetical protein
MSSIEVDSQDNVINHSVLSSKKNSLIDKTISKKEELDNNASEASFSFSKPSDIDDLYDEIGKKSNDEMDFVYESTLQTAEADLNQEIDSQFEKMAKREPGFDKNVKLISSNFYKGLVESITGNSGKLNQQTHILDKTNIGVTKIGSISEGIDAQTIKLKNDLSGVPFMIGDITNMDLSEKKKAWDNNDNEYILKDSKLFKEESSSNVNSKNKLDYKKTMSLEYSKEKESDKKEMISSSSQNKPSLDKRGSKSSKNPLFDEQK